MLPCRYVESGTLLNNYAHIFDLLIRLRQAVNHPYLVVYSATGGRNDSVVGMPGAAGAAAVVAGARPPPARSLLPHGPPLPAGASGWGWMAVSLARTGAAAGHRGYCELSDPCAADATNDEAPQPLLGVCGICHDPLEDGIGAACGHSFCRVCVTEYLDNSVGATDCPTCQRPLTIDLAGPSNAAAAGGSPESGKGKVAGASGGVRAPSMFKKRSILSRINTKAFQSSTKLEALNEAIQRMLVADPSAKCIVFSQFTSMLDLAHFRLQQVRPRALAICPRPCPCECKQRSYVQQ